jgi:hypothetical protein
MGCTGDWHLRTDFCIPFFFLNLSCYFTRFSLDVFHSLFLMHTLFTYYIHLLRSSHPISSYVKFWPPPPVLLYLSFSWFLFVRFCSNALLFPPPRTSHFAPLTARLRKACMPFGCISGTTTHAVTTLRSSHTVTVPYWDYATPAFRPHVHEHLNCCEPDLLLHLLDVYCDTIHKEHNSPV